MSAEDTGRISVSRDALRADLLDLELRLIKTLATKSDVEALEKRVSHLEQRAKADDAVDLNAETVFSRREKRAGLALAFAAIVVQALLDSGVLH